VNLSRKERALEARFRRNLAPWPTHSPWPGSAVCVLLAGMAGYLHNLPFAPFTLANGQQPVSAVLLALLAGMLLRNLIPATARLKPGADSMVKKWLPVGIVLLGARLDFYFLVGVAAQVLVGAAAIITVIILLTRVLSRWLGVPEKIGLLIGIGTAICGSSAIVAAAPVVEAKDEDVAYSIGVINLLGVVTMLLFSLGRTAARPGCPGLWCLVRSRHPRHTTGHCRRLRASHRRPRRGRNSDHRQAGADLPAGPDRVPVGRLVRPSTTATRCPRRRSGQVLEAGTGIRPALSRFGPVAHPGGSPRSNAAHVRTLALRRR